MSLKHEGFGQNGKDTGRMRPVCIVNWNSTSGLAHVVVD